jgi:hypothetical protein
MSLAMQRFVKRSDLVGELVEHWQAEHDEAMQASDVEELCGECVALAVLCRHAWEQVKTALFSGAIADTEATGRMVQAALDKSLEVLNRVAKLAADATRRGYEIPSKPDLERAVDTIAEIRSKLLNKWPFIDYKKLTRARAEYERGDYVTIEGMLKTPPSGD